MSGENNSADWQKRARQVAHKINIAWWLQTLAVPMITTTLILSCAVLLARREFADFPWQEVTWGVACIFFLIGILSWLVARRKFESPEHALVRLEASMKLRNSLSAAKAGVIPWPAAPKTLDDGTRWHWPRLLTPLLAAILFLSLSIFLPVSARTDTAAILDEPQAWKDLEAEIEELRENETVQEQYLKELEERIEELRDKKEDEWFSHSSLEATDALKKAHGSEISELQRKIKQAERSLKALQKNGTTLKDDARNRLLDEFQDALKGMENGSMKPNAELMDQLQGLNPTNLENMTQEQLDELRKSMRQLAEQMGQGQDGQRGGEDWIDDLLNEGQGGESQNGEGNGMEGEGSNGQGGINDGPGSNPNVLGDRSRDVTPGDMEGLESRDLSRTLPGDLLQLQDGEHEVNKAGLGIRDGGEAAKEGKGGDRIWKDSLMPDEKKALKEFFK